MTATNASTLTEARASSTSEAGSGIRALGLIFAAWVFALEYSVYLIGNDFADKAIKLGAALLMVLFARYWRKSRDDHEKVLFLMFCALLFTALLPVFFFGDAITGLSQWMKIAFMTVVFPLLLFSASIARAKTELLISLYLGFGIVFAVQAILGFFAVLSGMTDLSTLVEVGRQTGFSVPAMGALGFANAVWGPADGFRWLRPQGWFLEPSLLGSFLLLPAFIGIGRFLRHRKLRWLLSFLIVLTAILLTASFAAYLGFMVGLAFLALSKPLFGGLSRTVPVFKFVYPALIALALLAVAVTLIGFANRASEVNVGELEESAAVLTHIYARDPTGPSGNLLREVASIDLYISTVLSNPIGIGLAQTLGENELVAPNGLLFWAVAGGFPALIVLIVFFGYVFLVFCHPLLISANMLHRCIAASFIGHAVHNLSYGNWLAPYFLIHLVIVCLVARQARRDDVLSSATSAAF